MSKKVWNLRRSVCSPSFSSGSAIFTINTSNNSISHLHPSTMESLSWLLLSTAITLLIMKFLNYPHPRKNLPPGPQPWPLIGNLNLLGSLPHHSFHKLSQKYGKLTHLRFGSSSVVVASTAETAREILRTHDTIFASRPPTVAGKHISYNYHDVLWAPYGDYWIQGRKIYHTEVFSSKRLSSSEYIRVQEMRVFLSRLRAFSGDPVVLKDRVFSMTLSVINRIVLGRKYFNESKDEIKEMMMMRVEEFQEMLDEFFFLNGVLNNVGDWISWMGFIDLQGYVKRMKVLFKRFDRFNEHVLEEHRERMRVEGEGFVAKDVVDVLLKMAEDPSLEKLNYDDVKGLTQDLIIGGTDTTTTTVEWAMSELIKQPHLIKKATEELDRVIGKARWVHETDFTNLPFLDSVLKETMRLHPAAPLLAPHLALEDCKVSGYDITKGTIAFINIWSIGRDPELWDDPEAFRPERFLGKDIDVKGDHFELIPFGSGRRKCPGYMMGLKMVKLLIGNMLQGFNWKLPGNMRGEDVNMEELHGLSVRKKFPLVIVAEPRLPDHMYN